ncbi:FecR family protein [Pseudomonas tohonis]|uniref:FecR family protein n=1 Tax=Pseudomonas tohonis TaxID=2725477 RepID=UPI001F17E741|nr:FecR family protein [Pseudomonas tohonis]
MISHDLREQDIRQQAADWAIRLGAGALDAEQAQALARWQAEDPRHGPALQFAQRTWADLARLGEMPAPAYAPVLPRARPQQPARRRPRLRWAASAAAVLLLAGLGVEQGQQMLLPLLADHATAKGEVRQVQLPDGSRVELDTRSAIDLEFSDTERRVRLLGGDAYFTVAPLGPNETRPFVVESAGGTTRALGTQFLVSQDDAHGAWVGVTEHSVALALERAPERGAREQILQEGQSARYDAHGGIETLAPRDLQRATSWRRGVLVFERVPLGQVAEQLNRYRPGRVLISDSALAGREVSGVFRLDILDEALDTLTHELGVNRLDLPGVTFLY